MKTPIHEFVRGYAASDPLRLHMPGHKGEGALGVESWDITEIKGADSLYEASGVIAESEANASRVFGCQTLYSTEGASLCLRAMLYLTVLYAKEQGKEPCIWACRNAHKSFLFGVCLLDLRVEWLIGGEKNSYLSATITPQELEGRLRDAKELPTAVYLTSPDYLGTMTDIEGIASVCHRYGVLLLVDAAHGAYLRFLSQSLHPMDLGADLCCASAHKTLSALTGCAYLHLSSRIPKGIAEQAKTAMALFGSTSPSYLLLQSLDVLNPSLHTDYPMRLQAFLPRIESLKCRLTDMGYTLQGDEPLKITLQAKPYGYRGETLAESLRERGIECEFADPDFVVLMLTPALTQSDLGRLETALQAIPKRSSLPSDAPSIHLPKKRLSPREAMLSPSERKLIGECLGRILATATVACPPAVPIAVSGEEIDNEVLARFTYYGITECLVIKESK